MEWKDFGDWGGRISEWAEDYHLNVGDRPVRSRVKPGEVLAALPAVPPEQSEDMEKIFEDFETIVMPGITHWQHPRFFAYFNSNAAPASVLAEFLTAALSPQCMLWQTSPAATELETCMMSWLRVVGDAGGGVDHAREGAEVDWQYGRSGAQSPA